MQHSGKTRYPLRKWLIVKWKDIQGRYQQHGVVLFP